MYSMLPFLWYARVASATAWKGFRTAGAEVKDAGNAVFPEPQVDVSHVPHVDEVALEAVAAFEQFRAFAIIQLGIEVESDARHAAFVAFARPVDVKVAEADDLRIGFRQDLADVFVEQEFGVAVNVQRLFVLAGLDESRWCVRHRWPRREALQERDFALQAVVQQLFGVLIVVVHHVLAIPLGSGRARAFVEDCFDFTGTLHPP